ncbi:DegT/DnrJ/EryC1/StrS family aminotransferase [Streptomyces sp. SID3343]|uniref:DegT/DnrJ/EryC1/StrS family aminotransferase n=1 Tax=Streptomyces sp. SID3343 TaxID=2690260 RepID=UPI00136CA42E|nr:DegT/DnrJ/EryC1/StrS family aminotransferase [Streptomyces sp. SID3343]MYW04433.1 aminotransferase class I/II-fold pyridoxal phosphate-dependent enzyme [Streptomyces sp. SID3343]
MSADLDRIPLVDLAAAHAEVAAEVEAGWARVLAACAFVGGPDVAEFEREFAAFTGVAHCVAVANGTDAIELALRALGLPAGGGVVMPANTFTATAEAVVRAGGRPVFADVDDEFLLLDPQRAAEASAGPVGAAALVPVHLNGQLAPMGALEALARARGAFLVEDAAQAQGATQDGRGPGSWGPNGIAGTSFYPGKNLGAYGDAGAVVTGDDAHDLVLRELRDHGSSRKYVHTRLGFNSRLDTVQAVVLRAKLRRLADWNVARRAAAARYDSLLANLDGVRLPRTAPGNEHVWHLYAVRVPERDKVLALLNEAGVGAGVHYPVPVHLQPAFRELGHAKGDFPVAERAAEEILTLPLFPQLTAGQQERVAEVLAGALSRL